MNILLLLPEEKVGQSVFRVAGRKASHLLQVLKVQENDTVRAGVLNSAKGQFCIREIDRENLTVEGEFLFESDPENSALSRIIILSAYQRPQTVKKILNSAAVCGVGGIYFFPMEKSEKSYQTSSLWKREEYKEELYLGLEQGSRVKFPEIRTYSRKSDIFDFKDSRMILLEPSGTELMSDAEEALGNAEKLYFLLGPESGFSLREADLFKSMSLKTVRLSESVLRSEQAFLFAISQAELILKKTF